MADCYCLTDKYRKLLQISTQRRIKRANLVFHCVKLRHKYIRFVCLLTGAPVSICLPLLNAVVMNYKLFVL